jgi:putative hydrolase of the HAD superfamily
MTKAIIFDCFGVLATEAWLPFKAKYFDHDPKLMSEVNNISRQADRGLISREEAIRATAKLAGITPAEFTGAIDRNVPDEELFAYIRELKAKYKLGLLSNIADDYLHTIFEPDHLALFDAISLSFKKGFIKPQARAFEIIAEELGVEPEECVLVDDQQRNIDGARAAGMPAILYHDAAQLRQELAAILKKA